MRVRFALALASVLVCSSAAWADYMELYRFSFDTTGNAQDWNWKNPYQTGWPLTASTDGYQADTYDGTNYVNLGGQYPDLSTPDGALWPPTIAPATSGGALKLVNKGDWGYWKTWGFKSGLGLPANQDVMEVQFNSTTYDSVEHSQLWIDWYIREGATLDWARMRTKNLAVRGDVQDGEWWRTTYDLASIKNAEFVQGTTGSVPWWQVGGHGDLTNLNTVFAVNFVMNVHTGTTPAYSPYFLDDIRLIGIPEPGSLVLLAAGAGMSLLRRRRG